MPDLFDLAPHDLSLYYLGQIFGIVGTVLPINSPVIFLGTLFKVINTIALTVGAFILVYITVVGLLATAHEGEFLGKKWSGLWVPIRTVLGVASLFPASSGYSAIQIVVMWIIVQGVGAADTLWKSVITYTATVGSPYSSIGISSVNVSRTMQGLFQGLVCQESAAASGTDKTVLYYKNLNPSYTPKTYTPDATSYDMGPGGSCGSVILCNKADACTTRDSLGCWACEGQAEAVAQTWQLLNSIAKQFVATDTEYVQFSEVGGTTPTWILNFCAAPEQGVPAEACCRVKSPTSKTDCTTTIQWPMEFDSGATNNEVSANGLNFYEQWSLYPYLSGKGAPVKILPSPASNYDFINLATNQYIASISDYIAQQAANAPLPPNPQNWQSQALDLGWLTAGTFYYNISQMSANDLNSINPTFDLSPSDISKLPTSPMDGYRNNIKSAGSFANDVAGQSQSSLNTPAPPDYGQQINNTLTRMRGDLLNNFMKSMKTSSDQQSPLKVLSDFGNSMLNGAQYTYAVLAVAIPVASGVAAASNWITIGTGFGTSPLAEGVKSFLGFTAPLAYGTLGALFTFGALLAIYIPLIPFVVFTVTVLGWFIATIEAMVAAPIVALGILGPGGQHELLGRAEPSLMIIFNLFLRPTLMVMGLMAAMLLANVMLRFINSMYVGVMDQALGDVGNLGPAQQYVAVAAYVFLIFTVMNKVFTVIHLLPERVLTYIGGHAIQYGEAEATGAVKHGMEAAAGAAAAAGKATGEAGGAGAEKWGASRAHKKGKQGGPEVRED